ncbi:hypothetical protein B0H13DRAFT_1623761, partial [Mycena leptocephala]
THIKAIEESISDTKKSISGPEASSDSLLLLRHLQQTHETLSTQAQQLYALQRICSPLDGLTILR